MSLSLTRFVCLSGLSAALLIGTTAVRADNAAPSAKQRVTQAVVHLTFIKPSTLVSLFIPRVTNASPLDTEDNNTPVAAQTSVIPAGLIALSPDDVNGDLIVRGDNAAISEVEEFVRLFDVKPRSVRLNVSLVRYLPGNGEARREVEATASLQANQNALCETTIWVTGKAFRIRIAPHVNGDDSVTLTAEMSTMVQEGKVAETRLRIAKQRGTRRMKDAETKTFLILGLTSGAEAAAHAPKPIEDVSLPALGAFAEETFYLEVTPTVTALTQK